MLIVARFIHYIFFLYTVLIVARIIASWFPRMVNHPLLRLCGKLVDPYLNIFRRWIPPIGGRLDLSPMLAFLGLTVLEKCLLALVFS